MPRLNYRHLEYFHEVLRCGGVRAAAERLHLAPQTVSAQLKQLEDALGQPLLQRSGRRLEATAAGRMALRYAEEIFAIGEELRASLQSGAMERPLELRVGTLDCIPKSITHWLLEPALLADRQLRIVCRERSFEELLNELAMHRIDLIIADAPHPQGAGNKCFDHPLGGSGLSCFATPTLATAHPGTFPACLHGAPILLPREDTAWRAALWSWLQRQGVQPWIRGEFDDTALMKSFGHAGSGFFFAASAMAEEICRQYGVTETGSTHEVRQQLYAISAQRRITHPAVRLITEHARAELMPAKQR
jgi:LysR family transcriptional regulator, transcriptional activator of nhaA